MDKTTKRRNIIGIIVLLFANSAAGGAEWCSSALANIAQTFPDVPYWVITLVNNIPNLCAVVFTLVAGLLVNRVIPLKTMILIGIGLHATGGILPALAGENSIAVMFIGRFAFGIGYGLMQGIGISMSFKLVENENLRTHAMGWAVAAQYSMNMVAQVVVGRLCEIQWNYSFYIYLWSFIPFFIVLFLCQNFPVDKADFSAIGGSESSLAKGSSLGESVRRLPGNVWVFTVIVGVYMLSYYPIFLLISPIIVNRGMGTAVDVGTAMVFYSVATIVGGVVFGALEKIFKHRTLGLFLLGVAVSIIGLYFARSFAMVCIWLLLSGITSTGIIPGCINAFNGQVRKEDVFLATGITESGVNLGAFLSTPFIALIEGFGGSADQALIFSPIILIIMAFITVRCCRKATV